MDHDSFDAQAARFDERAGVPDDACRRVAEAVVTIVGSDATLLEIGAGTGAIGYELCRLLPGYRALDVSARMLEIFAQRLGSDERLVVGDAGQRWPARDGSLTAVFGSRALHLIDMEHVIGELHRSLVPGGVLLAGRVERDPDDPRELLRAEMRRRLAELIPDARPRRRRGLVAALVERGAEPLARREVADWATRWTPRQVLDAWSRRQPLSGVALGSEARQTLLCGLERWAKDHLGGLDVPFDSRSTYTLAGARLSAK